MKTSDYTILFADDNPSVMLSYFKAFNKAGFRVLSCENAAQVLAELKVEKVDLLVTDLEMPDANTFETLEILKREYPKLPVIVVSGHYKGLQPDFNEKGYKISAFIHKPCGVNEVMEKVREVLRIDDNKSNP
jgi:DNA-binding NtrC family response regulator